MRQKKAKLIAKNVYGDLARGPGSRRYIARKGIRNDPNSPRALYQLAKRIYKEG